MNEDAHLEAAYEDLSYVDDELYWRDDDAHWDDEGYWDEDARMGADR